ncbi:MAG TPA: CocE/NonD family hydrolase [Gaiellaceae bacterium]|nr:CocE/NonD family hydrolase [Gaiellaceae bacterium]
MSVAADRAPARSSLRERAGAARVETKVAAAGLAAVGVHVLDDSFFQPEPGTSAADHLVSGLGPVAVLAVAAMAYPRLRPGFQAALAIVLGLFGVVAGSVEPAYYGPDAGLSGDDFTGLVAVAGGAALVAVGTRTAWRWRRRDDSPRRRYVRRALLAVSCALAGFFVLLPLFLSYGFTHVARLETPNGRLGAPYEAVSFRSSDGLRLAGWLVPSRNGATVIVCPGKNGTQTHARMLVRHGYGVLVFDRRGEGASEGDPNALGWGFDQDLIGALAYLRGRGDVDPQRIGGLGLSVGGEAFLQTAAETGGLGAVVSDGAGSRSVREDTVRTTVEKVPEIVFSGVMTAGMAVFSDRLPPPNLKALAGRIQETPVFLIHATRGAGGEDNQPRYYEGLRGPKQIWKIDTSHTHGLAARPQEYERRVVGFLDRALLGS